MVGVVLPLVFWLSSVFKDTLLDCELGRRTCMKCVKEVYKTTKVQALSAPLPTPLFQRALPGTDGTETYLLYGPRHIYVSVPLPQNISQGRTLMVVDRDIGGHYPCSMSENKTSNIIVLTLAERKGDLPLRCCPATWQKAMDPAWLGHCSQVILPTERLS